MNRKQILAYVAALGCSLAIGGNAMAGLVVYRYADHYEDDLIVNHNDIFIAGFTPVLTTAPTTPGSVLHNSMRLSFRSGGSTLTALVSGNDLPLFPPEPFQSLALCSDGGLNQLGKTIDASRGWVLPFLDLESGAVDPATLTTGVLDIDLIPDNGFGYVGYSTSDLSQFGYMQIQRLSLLEWRLIGYAYNDSGTPVVVQNIVPSGSAIALLAAGGSLISRRRHPRM